MAGDDKRGKGGLGSRLKGWLPDDLKNAGGALKHGRQKNRLLGRAVRRVERQSVRGAIRADRVLPGDVPSARLPDDVIAQAPRKNRSIDIDGRLETMGLKPFAGPRTGIRSARSPRSEMISYLCSATVKPLHRPGRTRRPSSAPTGSGARSRRTARCS